MFCHMCGQKLAVNARFCPKCGTAVAQIATEITEKRRSKIYDKETEEIRTALDRIGRSPASAVAQIATEISKEFREEIYNKLSEVTLGGLESGEISVVDSKEIAQFVLDRLDNINTREELGGFFDELTKNWPIHEQVCGQLLDGSNHAENTEPSSGFAEKFMQEIEPLDAAARTDGEVSDEIFEKAISLYETLESSHEAALLGHPNLPLARITLNFYHDVKIAIEFFRTRWENDRLKRGRQSLFKRQVKVVVADYNTFGTSCKTAWELVEYVGVPSIKHATTTGSFLLGYPRLLPYFDQVLVKKLFIALLMDGEDPRSHKGAFSGVKDRYGNRYIDQLLRDLTKLR